MHKVRILIGVAALLGLGIGIAAETPYRLAGIIVADEGRALALIEMPDGEQRLFRAGDAIEDGRVAEITPDTVRLEFTRESVVLALAGTGNPEWILPTEYHQEDYAVGGQQSIDKARLRAISQLASSAAKADSNALASKVLTNLDLPPQARIMAINDQPVESTAEALRQMAASIDAKASAGSQFQFVVSIADMAGNKRVYIMSDDAGHVTEQTIQAN